MGHARARVLEESKIGETGELSEVGRLFSNITYLCSFLEPPNTIDELPAQKRAAFFPMPHIFSQMCQEKKMLSACGIISN